MNTKSRNVFKFNQWTIRKRVFVIVFLIVILTVTAATGFNIVTTANNMTRAAGEEMAAYAGEAIQHSGDIVLGSVKSLEALAISPILVQAVEQANLAYLEVDQGQLDDEIASLDQAWKDEDASVERLVKQIAQNDVSAYLRNFMATFPEEVEVFATDIQGLNVAMTERTGDYLQADEGWWQGAYQDGEGGTYVSEVDYDESANAWAIDIGVPIRDAAGDVIGILRGTVDISVVFGALSKIEFGQTGYAALFDKQGKILYAQNNDLLMEQAPEALFAFVNGEESWNKALSDLDGNPAVVASSPLEGELGNSLGWVLLLEQDLREVYAPMQQTLVNSLLIDALILAVMLVMGFLFARSLSRPIKIMAGSVANIGLRGDLNRETPEEVKKAIMNQGGEIGEMGLGLREMEIYLQHAAEAATTVAQGDLTVQFRPLSEDDELGSAINRMIESLRIMITEVQENANSVGLASNQLSAAAEQAGAATNQITSTIQQVAQGTSQQTNSINETASSVDQMARAIEGVAKGAQEQAAAVAESSQVTAQMSATIQQVAANAQAGAKGANDAAQTAKSGAVIVEKNLEGMSLIKEKVGLSAQKVEEMGVRSDQIGMIVETIDDIASQTNLLALNAAIEAARAGEHGKGFAVVADEVRKLAERTATATKEISELIEEVQATVTEAVGAMDESADEVERGVSQAGEAGKALESILEAVEQVNQQVEEITAAAEEMEASSNELVGSMDSVSAIVEENTASTEEMSAGSTQVTQAIENIASISEENSAATEEVSASTEEMSAQVEEVSASSAALTEMAQALLDIVARFKLDMGDLEDVNEEPESEASVSGGNGKAEISEEFVVDM